MDSPADADDPPPPSPSSFLEIRLFYVRIAPCSPDSVPPFLTLSHLRRSSHSSLEINGHHLPPTSPSSISLRRDRLDRDVTYLSTDRVRLTGASEFTVSDPNNNLILCGSLDRMDVDSESKGWSMDCYSAAAAVFVQPKMGISSPAIEVYVAGCFAGFPLILTQTVQLSPRRKVGRAGVLDAIPEDDEGSGTERKVRKEAQHLRALPSSSVTEGEIDEYDSDMKVGHNYPEGWYVDDDGQLTWFNAGVRVGVGIGLGMCVGIGIGVGLLMRSYQATTRGFRRRFF